MHLPWTLRIAPLWYAFAIAAGAQSTSLQSRFAPPLVLRAGSGATEFTLSNPTATAEPLNLNAGPVLDAASSASLPKPKLAFALVPGGAAPPAKIDPGQTLHIEVTATDVSGTGSALATVFNGGTELGQLQMVALDAPFNLLIDGDGNPDKPLLYTLNQPVTLTVKNSDAEAYLVNWVLQIDGGPRASGQLTIPPDGSSPIVLHPSPDDYFWTDSIRPSTKKAALLLSLAGPEDTQALLPARPLPVTLSMRRSGPNATAWWSHLYIFFNLLLGGALSLLASGVLPNVLRKVALREQIRDVAERTSSVSTRIDSYLRVLLRLERKKISLLIQGAKTLSPSTGDTLDQVTVALDRLTKRLKLSERLDDLRRRFEDCSASAPPSVSDNLDKILQSAAEQLHSFALPDEDLAASSAFLDKAEASLAMLDDADALAKLIAANFKDLQARLKTFPQDYCADLRTSLPGLFVILEKPFDDPKNIVRPMMFALDHGVTAIQLALDYAMVRASVPVAASDNCPEPAATLARLKTHECDLVDLLGTLSWRALREATTLVQQMRENVYEADLLEEIRKPGQAYIMLDTQTARPSMPVFFSICFRVARFNGSAAIHRLVSHWNFPDGLSERGWKVCHFFHGTEPEVQPPHPAAAPAATPPPAATGMWQRLRRLFARRRAAVAPQSRTLLIAVTLGGQVAVDEETTAVGHLLTNTIDIKMEKKPPERSRAVAETLRFGIAFGVALAGLLSGALNQFDKLDFLSATIAILALGFGADSIKNLLTQAPKKG